jgi:hypothetical protein
MININLNDKVEAKANTTGAKSGVIPAGIYNTKVDKIESWKEITKDVMVNLTDDRGRIMRDEDGKIIKELQKDVTFYTADVQLSITEGEYTGRKIFTNLTTHPNALFITQSFLHATKSEIMRYADIPTNCLGKTLAVETFNEERFSNMIDPQTGLETQMPRTYTKVKSFIRPTLQETGNDNGI